VKWEKGRIEKITPGGQVDLKMDSFSGKVFKGTVETIIAAADSRTRAFRIKVSVPNSTGELMSGMFGRADVLLAPVNGIIVPRQALIRGSQSDSALAERELTSGPKTDGKAAPKTEYYVYTVDSKKVKKTNVSIGAINEKQALITKGLQKGSKVVTLGQEELQENDEVQIARGK
jgi:Membrane-fusion protein